MRVALCVLAFALALAASGAGSAAGDPIDPFTLDGADGRRYSLDDLQGPRATVIFFIGAECPMVARYAPRMNALHAVYAPRGVGFLAVNSNALERPGEIADHARRCAFPFPVLLDPEQSVADRLRVRMTPTAVLLDADRAVRYRGAIDDHKAEEFVRARHLRDALEAVLDRRAVATPETEPAGCEVRRQLRPDPRAEVNYASHVAPILNRHCVACHRPGQVAPFSLDSYERASRWVGDIRRATRTRFMPPWKPVNSGTFRHERRLTDAESDILAQWADAGAPPGDLSKAPPRPSFPAGWILGEPDLVLEAEEYEVGPNGPDEYRCFVLPTDLPDDAWVSAAEVQPGNLNVVHHIIAYVDTSGAADRLDRDDPKPGYRTSGTGPNFIPSGEMGGWAPGYSPYGLPQGVGRLLQRGARIVLEVHYHRNGRTEKDRPRIGLRFAREPIAKRLRWLQLVRFDLRIPAGEPRHRVVATYRLREDVHALAIMPHMHLLGREIRVVADLPDGTRKTLVDILDWDFNWQDIYHFREPLKLPKGTRLRLEAIYDNSEANPNNPNRPPKEVRWGEQTSDEMCIAFISTTRDREARPEVRLGMRLRGLEVASVEPGGPADRAGLLPGDRIVRCGKRIFRGIEALHRILERAEDAVVLVVSRGGQEVEVTVPPEDQSE